MQVLMICLLKNLKGNYNISDYNVLRCHLLFHAEAAEKRRIAGFFLCFLRESILPSPQSVIISNI